MKMKQQHYEYIKSKMADCIGKNHYTGIVNNAKSDSRVKDLNTRIAWDCLHTCNISAWICDNLYSYLDDNHINTAVKRIVRELYA